jgi:hypothetical protein
VSQQGPEMCRFSDAGNEGQPQARRPASEQRQGTKSQGSGAPLVPHALWGFSYGVRVGKVGSKMLRPRFAVKDGCGDGRNERRGRFRRGLAV